MVDEPADPPAGKLRAMRSIVRAAARRLASDEPFRRSSADEPLCAVFGPLETEALEALWRRAEPASVRSLQRDLAGVAYTTLMTTLDRLYKKGVLERERRGRAFHYAPRFDRKGLRAHLAADAIEALLGGGRGAIRPVLSSFVEAVSRRDALLLDELERLVRERRAREEPR
jgi:predicted transcriptional regulator